ncbi:MAG: hypothetical protein KF733_03930 [Fimbriimonadaceae bacterium]|nr:MAG: hypothetical protein KF733_03930 [Fimbriimonadaceae bacterium]
MKDNTDRPVLVVVVNGGRPPFPGAPGARDRSRSASAKERTLRLHSARSDKYGRAA